MYKLYIYEMDLECEHQIDLLESAILVVDSEVKC